MWQAKRGSHQRLDHPWRMAAQATLLSLLLLILGSLGLALMQAREAERAALDARGERFLQRIEQVFGQLRQALDRLERQPLRQCDRAMRELLAQVSFDHRFVQEAAFIDGDQYCSSQLRQLSSPPLRMADVQAPPHRYWLDTTAEPQGDLTALRLARGPFHVFTARAHLLDMVDLSDGAGLYLIPRGSRRALPILGTSQPLPLGQSATDGLKPETLRTVGDRLLYRMAGDDPAYQLALVVPSANLYKRILATWHAWLPGCLLLALLIGASTYLLVRTRQSLKWELQAALDHRELQVHYQPILELASRRCIGAEALIRWLRPDGSPISPELFIPLAESTGQIRQITDFLLQQVLEQLGELLREHPGLYISVNLAACDVCAPRVGLLAERLLARYRVSPAQIAFEITERGLLDLDSARSHLEALRARGHRVLIDDFGTGYANLAYLQELPVDCLKIDRAFISALPADAGGRGVAPHIIRMARDLKIEVIAEGIEHEEQARLLALEGADYGQGWLFARPLTAHQFRELIDRQSGDLPVTRVA